MTYEAGGHDAVEALEGLYVLIGEKELHHPGVPEQVTQGGLGRERERIK